MKGTRKETRHLQLRRTRKIIVKYYWIIDHRLKVACWCKLLMKMNAARWLTKNDSFKELHLECINIGTALFLQ